MNYLLYIFFGILPSLIWLSYFLRKDKHPEPNRKVLEVFFFGAIVTLPAIFLELGFGKIFELFDLSLWLSSLFGIIFGVALIEEVLKYLVIRFRVLNSPEFDEPIDAMLYMIIAALGFAAIENILLFFKPGIFVEPYDPIFLSLVRFIGATFLHALSSAILGYFLALSLFRQKNHFRLLFTGLALAIILHGFYNFTIIEIEGPWKIYSLFLTLSFMAIFVSLGLRRLKRLKSICKIT